MNTEVKLENYLSQLDRALWALPVGQRSEIITEIKSHIREAMERDPSKPIDTVLADMGSAQDVANKYITERGVKTLPPTAKTGPWFKYLAYGFFGFCSMILIFVLVLIWKFTPLIKVDSSKNRVALLGGTIDIDQNAFDKIKLGDINLHDMEDGGNVSSGDQAVLAGVRQIKIPFNTAKLSVAPSENAKLAWHCKSSAKKLAKAVTNAGVMTLDLEVLNFAKCDLEVPKNIEVLLKGVNGKISIDELQGPMTLDLVNGKVDISPDDEREYNFDVNVKNGMADKFESSLNPKAIKMKVSVVNGLIHNEQE